LRDLQAVDSLVGRKKHVVRKVRRGEILIVVWVPKQKLTILELHRTHHHPGLPRKKPVKQFGKRLVAARQCNSTLPFGGKTLRHKILIDTTGPLFSTTRRGKRKTTVHIKTIWGQLQSWSLRGGRFARPIENRQLTDFPGRRAWGAKAQR